MSARAVVSVVGFAAALAVSTPRAEAYEFDVRSFSLGQGYQLRLFRPVSGDILVNRRRYTQTLSLNIWNIGKPRSYELYDTTLDHEANYFVSALLRVDHDFGEYTGGEITIGSDSFEATDLIPELHEDNLDLMVLYAYGGGRGIAGFLDVEVGRQLSVDTLDWWSFDGATVRAHTPWRFSVEAFGGTRVRDMSPLGSSVQEPDGTSGSECAEYVERAVPGSGSWLPIPRVETGDPNPFESDFDLCPQRDEVMPTFGGAVETQEGPLGARIAYRRSVSRTPGVIGPVDRFEFPDTGLYPNENGEAPGWGVNEERITASVRYHHRFARGRGRLTPFAAARYSLLHALADEAFAGVRFRYGAHEVAPEYFYSFPTFDGDSIFNVFSSRPYHDVRVTYELRPTSSALSGYARGWIRRFGAEDETSDPYDDAFVGEEQNELAGGGQLGARYRHGPRSYARLDLFHDDGFGGKRTGGYGSARWRVRDDLDLASRLSVIYFNEDLLTDLDGTTLGAQVGASYELDDGVGLHLTVEENTNRYYDSQLRVIAVLDLAYKPEI